MLFYFRFLSLFLLPRLHYLLVPPLPFFVLFLFIFFIFILLVIFSIPYSSLLQFSFFFPPLYFFSSLPHLPFCLGFSSHLKAIYYFSSFCFLSHTYFFCVSSAFLSFLSIPSSSSAHLSPLIISVFYIPFLSSIFFLSFSPCHQHFSHSLLSNLSSSRHFFPPTLSFLSSSVSLHVSLFLFSLFFKFPLFSTFLSHCLLFISFFILLCTYLFYPF